MAEIAPSCLLDGVMATVDDVIQIARHDLDHFVQTTKIVLAASRIDESGQGEGSKVADRNFIRCAVLDNFGT